MNDSYGSEEEFIRGRQLANGDLKDVWKKLSEVAEYGCAQRKGDEERMSRIEKGNDRIHSRLDWITVLLVGNLAALAINLASKYFGK